MDRDNRKSHLAPQLSPATQDLLRSSDSPTSYHTQAEPTPTSGEIPILGVRERDQHGVGSIPNEPQPPLPATNSSGRGSGRPSGPPVHPGMGPRVASTNSVHISSRDLQQQQQAPRQHVVSLGDLAGGPRSSGARVTVSAATPHTFALPVRPCPHAGERERRLPPPPPPARKASPSLYDERRRDRSGSGRQQTPHRVPPPAPVGGYSSSRGNGYSGSGSGYPHQ
jgi:mitogen-activated protein kinase kinase